MAVNDILEVSALYSVNGEKCATVHHFSEDVTPPSTDPEVDCADAFLDYIWPKLRAVMSTDCELQMIRCRRIAPTLGGGILSAQSIVGLVAEDTLPPNNCAVMSFYTVQHDRSGRGRIHIPGIPDTFQGDGLIEVAQIGLFNDIGDAFSTWITGSGGGQWTPVIYSKTHSYANAITGYKLRSWIHTLRSRRMVAP